MKKTLITAALIGIIGITGAQFASAHGVFGGSYGGSCGNESAGTQAYSEKDRQAYETFFTDTKSLRKEITVKKSELNALYRQDNPDEKKVAALTGELYDLETQIGEKAKTAGLADNFSNGHGPGMMWGNNGWGGGGHMMGW